jgi:hypothetical protein
MLRTMAEVMFNRGKFNLGSGALGWVAGDVRALLLSGASVPAGCSDPDLNTVSELLAVSGAVEATGTGYVRKQLASKTATEDDANNRLSLDAADTVWTSIDCGTVRAIVLHKEGASDAARELISIHDTGFPKVTNGGDLTIVWDAAGILTLT